eukprot:COSAG01_NODE_343_length_18564_cov_10.381099_1_plen_267_part_10
MCEICWPLSSRRWLGLILGTKLWFAFFPSAVPTEAAFSQQMDRLARELGERGRHTTAAVATAADWGADEGRPGQQMQQPGWAHTVEAALPPMEAADPGGMDEVAPARDANQRSAEDPTLAITPASRRPHQQREPAAEAAEVAAAACTTPLARRASASAPVVTAPAAVPASVTRRTGQQRPASFSPSLAPSSVSSSRQLLPGRSGYSDVLGSSESPSPHLSEAFWVALELAERRAERERAAAERAEERCGWVLRSLWGGVGGGGGRMG